MDSLLRDSPSQWGSIWLERGQSHRWHHIGQQWCWSNRKTSKTRSSWTERPLVTQKGREYCIDKEWLYFKVHVNTFIHKYGNYSVFLCTDQHILKNCSTALQCVMLLTDHNILWTEKLGSAIHHNSTRWRTHSNNGGNQHAMTNKHTEAVTASGITYFSTIQQVKKQCLIKVKKYPEFWSVDTLLPYEAMAVKRCNWHR